jgi:hypothetical protein
MDAAILYYLLERYEVRIEPPELMIDQLRTACITSVFQTLSVTTRSRIAILAIRERRTPAEQV